MTYYVERIHYVLGDGTARHCNADLPGTLDQIEDRVRRITQDGCWISGGTDDVPGVVRSFLSPTAIRMIDIIAVERPKLATGKTVRLDRADDPQTTVTPIRADNPPKEAPTMTTYASSLARLKATRDALHQQHADNAFASDNLANAIAFLDRQIGLDAQSMVDMGLSDEVRLLLGAPPVALHLHLEQPAAEPFRCPTCGNGLQVVAISRYTQLCDIDEATGAIGDDHDPDDAIGDTIERWVECRTCCTPLDQFAISEQMVKTDDSEAFLERVAVRNPAVHGPMTARKEETARAYLTEADAVLRTLPDERLQSANIAAAAASITAALRFLHDPRVKE